MNENPSGTSGLCLPLIGASMLLGSAAFAQAPAWDAEQAEVWERIEESWVDDVAENDRWPGSYLRDNAVSWSDTHPAPRALDQILAWTRFMNESGNVLHYEITPAAIAIDGNAAVAHYYLLVVTEDQAEERETSVESLVEVLVRRDGEWKFLSLTAFTPKLGGGN